MKSSRHVKILVVEDDCDLSDAFMTVLTKKGYSVSVAENGQAALRVLSKERDIDLILLDLLMPVMDGKEFLRHLDKQSGCKIVVFSNLDTQDDIKEIQELGADKYMLKSWASPTEIIRAVEEITAA